MTRRYGGRVKVLHGFLEGCVESRAASHGPGGFERWLLEAVRVLRQRLAAGCRDQEQVLEADAADALDALDAGLDRDHVADDELVVAGEAECRRLVHLQAHPVAEAEVEAVAELPAGLARPLGRVAG